MKLFLLLFFLPMAVWAQSSKSSDSAEIENLKRRLDDLERRQEEYFFQSTETSGKVQSFLPSNLSLGGFFEPVVTTLYGPYNHTQISPSTNTLGLNFAAEYNDHMRFVGQVLTGLSFPVYNPHNNPNATALGMPEKRSVGSPLFGALLTQGYIEFTKSQAFNVQAGMGYVPFGYAFQQRELVLFIRQGGPQILRTTNLNGPLWQGVHVNGAFSGKSNRYGYNLYTFAPNILNPDTNVNNTKVPGVGGRIWSSYFEDRLTTGLSSQYGENGALEIHTVGADIRYDDRPYLVTIEFAQNFNEAEDPWAAYIEPGYYLKEDLLAYIFFDYSHNRENYMKVATLVQQDPFEKIEWGTGFNWLPTNFTRFRVGLTEHTYIGRNHNFPTQGRNYTSLDLSAGIAF